MATLGGRSLLIKLDFRVVQQMPPSKNKYEQLEANYMADKPFLVGTWTLVSWVRNHSDGKTEYPLGEKPVGLLVYTLDNQMIVQMLARERPQIDSGDPLGGTTDERATAYSSCLAYFGTYKIVGASEVKHFIESSLYPNWSGEASVRNVEIQDNHLILSTNPTTGSDDGVSVVNKMSWLRNITD